MKWDRAVLLGVAVCYGGTALAAYNVGPVPVQWIAQGSLVALALAMIVTRDRLQVVPGGLVLVLFIAYAVLVNIVFAQRFAPLLPARATLPYPFYVGVRYINLLAFAAAFYLTYWLQSRGHREALIKRVMAVAVIFAGIAVYIYCAQLLGLPQPPRTRLGTGGGEQATAVFSTSDFFYNRMLGTFREPSHLAEWLLLPLFLLLARSGVRNRLGFALLTVTMLLTVSLTGIFSAVGGWFAALVFQNPLRMANLRRLAVGVLVIVVAGLAVKRLSVGLLGDLSIYSILNARTLELLESGVTGSNRGYVYEFLQANPPPFTGFGLGNGNVYFSSVVGSDLPNSFLSLYVATVYGAGIPGLLLLLLFLMIPIFRLRRARGAVLDPTQSGVLMAYLAYLVAFSIAPEELSVTFGITAGLLTYRDAKVRESVVAAPIVPVEIVAGG